LREALRSKASAKTSARTGGGGGSGKGEGKSAAKGTAKERHAGGSGGIRRDATGRSSTSSTSTSTSSGQMAAGTAANNGTSAAVAAIVGILEGGAALLRNGSSIDEARSLYSRQAVTKAMGMVRQRILQEGLCGVRPNSSTCVGKWCDNAGPWGIAVPKVYA
jgi:hypothetical protein